MQNPMPFDLFVIPSQMNKQPDVILRAQEPGSAGYFSITISNLPEEWREFILEALQLMAERPSLSA